MYIIKLNKVDQKIKDISLKETYEFKPKNGGLLQSFSIYDQKSLQKILAKKYLNLYKKFVNDLESTSEDSEEGFVICLNELTKLHETLEYKYKKYLKKELYEKFINDLVLYDKYIQNKIIMLNYDEEVKSKGR